MGAIVVQWLLTPSWPVVLRPPPLHVSLALLSLPTLVCIPLCPSRCPQMNLPPSFRTHSALPSNVIIPLPLWLLFVPTGLFSSLLSYRVRLRLVVVAPLFALFWPLANLRLLTPLCVCRLCDGGGGDGGGGALRLSPGSIRVAAARASSPSSAPSGAALLAIARPRGFVHTPGGPSSSLSFSKRGRVTFWILRDQRDHPHMSVSLSSRNRQRLLYSPPGRDLSPPPSIITSSSPSRPPPPLRGTPFPSDVPTIQSAYIK